MYRSTHFDANVVILGLGIALSLNATASAAAPPAQTRASAFLEKSVVSKDGIITRQFASTAAFPTFAGSPNPLSTAAAGTAMPADSLQSIQLLLKLDSGNASGFMLRTTGDDKPALAGAVAPGSLPAPAPHFSYTGLSGQVSRHNFFLNYVGTYPAGANHTPPKSEVHGRMIANGNSLGYLHYDQWWDTPASATATHVLMTLYMLPDTAPRDVVKTWGNFVVQFNEAELLGNHILAGRALTRQPLRLVADAYTLDQWRRLPIIARSADLAPPGYFRHFVDAGMSAYRPALADPHDNQQIAFMEQRVIPFHAGTAESARYKRCAENVIYKAYTIGVQMFARLLGIRSNSVCESAPSFDYAPQIHIAATADTQPSNIDLSVYDVTEVGPAQPPGTPAARATPGFDRVLGLLACEEDPTAGAAIHRVCVDDEWQALSWIGEMPLATLQATLRQIHDYNDRRAESDVNPNPSTRPRPPLLNTGNRQLDDWLLQHPQRGESLLDNALLIAQVSDSRNQPQAAVNLNRNTEPFIKASCVGERVSQVEQSDWQCVEKSKKKVGATGPRIAVPPQVQRGRQFYTRGDPEFSSLTQRVANAYMMPPGYAAADMATMVYGIAYDSAPPGMNRGIIYLPSAQYRTTTAPNRLAAPRFRFGIAHITAPGSGGGTENGHAGDWARIGVTGRNQAELDERIARIIMTALSDDNVVPTQTIRRDNHAQNYLRVYPTVAINDGHRDARILYTNIVIVLGTNGMVITAYPAKDSVMRVDHNAM